MRFHDLAGGAGLWVTSVMPSMFLRGGLHVFDRFHDLDAASFAAAAGMDSGL